MMKKTLWLGGPGDTYERAVFGFVEDYLEL